VKAGWGKMTGWDILDKVINNFPPIVMGLMLVSVLVAFIIFMVGFAKHGTNFVKYGFKQKEVGDLAQKLDDLRAEFKSDLEIIKINHFGHLKEFLTELTSILLDKGVINNQDKARLDNKLRGM
jgi:hypothetical protein